MAIADSNVVDGIAFEKETLIMEIYDHLNFDEGFEFDHIDLLQDKLNTYLWYINSKQYADIYTNKEFNRFIINIHFLNDITDNCQKFIDVSNKKLAESNIEIVPILKKAMS